VADSATDPDSRRPEEDEGQAAPDAAVQKALDKASRKRMLIGVGGTIIVLLIIFVVILPQFIDYEAVIDAFLSMELWQHGVLLVMMAVTWVVLGFQFRTTLPGLDIVSGTLAMIASLGVKGSIPGPMDTAFRFRLAVAYKYSVEESTLSAATIKALDWVARLLMPSIAVAILITSGQSIAGLEWLAILGVILSIGGIALLVGVIRSERLARWIGDKAQLIVGSLAKRFKRTAPGDLSARILGLRETGQSLVSTRGLLGLGLTLVIQAGYAVMLTLAMAFVGVDFDVLPVSVIWATLAIVYMLPIGPGLIELAYIFIFSLYLGRDNPMLAPASAGVMVFRVYQWLIPIPIGYALIAWWQKRDKFSLLSTDTAQIVPEASKPEPGG